MALHLSMVPLVQPILEAAAAVAGVLLTLAMVAAES
jgi:hypothetical protein